MTTLIGKAIFTAVVMFVALCVGWLAGDHDY